MMRSEEEWAKKCHDQRHLQGNKWPSLCAPCARAHARECVETWREKAILAADNVSIFNEARQLPEDRKFRDLAIWVTKYPDSLKRTARRAGLKKAFGLSLEEYDRMLAQQQGVCALCGWQPKRIHLAVDHCHKTGRIRGLLCGMCNGALAYLENTTWMRRAITYLQ